MTLLGVRTIEGFGVMVDNIAHRFVATTTIVAANREGCHHEEGGIETEIPPPLAAELKDDARC